MNGVQKWLASGSPWVWLTAGAVSFCLVMVLGLIVLIAGNGLGHFWPAPLALAELRGEPAIKLLGEQVDDETVAASRVREGGGKIPADAITVHRRLFKRGNRDLGGQDFQWVNEPDILRISYPDEAIAIERLEWGSLFGYLRGLREGKRELAMSELPQRLARAAGLRKEIERLQVTDIGGVNYALERLRLREKVLHKQADEHQAEIADIETRKHELETRYTTLTAELKQRSDAIGSDVLLFEAIDGQKREVPLAKVVRVYSPNRMTLLEKMWHYAIKLREFICESPREANTEGGVFPAIFGTILLVLLMSVFVTPLGVIAAVYLREYARPGPVTSAIRIAVNNLAGVPSVVYGVFGFGFFVYLVGGSIDEMFFADSLPSPTFGTPGLLWSALTLTLLTVPVVIVATEEGLSRIPRTIREGSLALGATKAETLWRTVLPMATPAMMTGLILAVARAAGEVAPLMLVGVVKLAPALPLDGNFPYLHLDRKFMHLGFHIYDVGFQSPNVEAARPLVYSTALLLVVIILSLNLAAIRLRNRLREKYNATE